MRELLRGVLLAGGGSAVAIAFWAVVLKLLAVVAGPAGVGAFSLLRQLQQTAATLGMLNGHAALVQGLASPALPGPVYWRASLRVIIVGVGLVVFGLLLGAPLIAQLVFGHASPESAALVRALVPCIVLLVAVNVLSAVLTSRRALGAVAAVQAASGVGAILLAWPAAVAVRDGRLWPIVAVLTGAAGLGLAASLVAVVRTGGIPPFAHVHKDALGARAQRDFLSTAFALLATGGLTLITPLIARALLLRARGLESVGLFDSAWTVSVTFVMLILAAIHAYYLPTLSGAPDTATRDELLRRFFRFSALLVFPALMLAQALKPLLVRLLFSESFVPSLAAMRWMLAGDYLLVGAWMLSLPMLLFKDFRAYLITQLLWSVGFLGSLTLVVQRPWWMNGVGMAFMAWHAVVFGVALTFTALRYGLRLDRELLGTWLPGAVLLALATWATWNSKEVHWPTTSGVAALAVLACYGLAGRPSLRGLLWPVRNP